VINLLLQVVSVVIAYPFGQNRADKPASSPATEAAAGLGRFTVAVRRGASLCGRHAPLAER